MSSSFFQIKPKTKATAAAKAIDAVTVASQFPLPASEDSVISAFYAQLTDRERIAHSIAVEKLGTSYDVTRTHGFIKWKRLQSQAVAK